MASRVLRVLVSLRCKSAGAVESNMAMFTALQVSWRGLVGCPP